MTEPAAFYHNYVFKKEDLDRATFKNDIWFKLKTLFYPTYVQISDNYAWKYKIINHQYYFLGYEKWGEA